MESIQSSINSMISSGSRAVMAVKAYQTLKAKQLATAQKAEAKELAKVQNGTGRASVQAQAAARAKQSAADAIEAKKAQRRDFMEYLKKQPSSLGVIGDLDPALQKKIAKQYTPSMRKRIMDAADKEGRNGKHK